MDKLEKKKSNSFINIIKMDLIKRKIIKQKLNPMIDLYDDKIIQNSKILDERFNNNQ